MARTRRMTPDGIPLTIDPGRCPGGLIFRTYAVGGELIVEDRIAEPGFAAFAALTSASDVVDDPRSAAGVVLAVYDGDDGGLFSSPIVVLP